MVSYGNANSERVSSQQH